VTQTQTAPCKVHRVAVVAETDTINRAILSASLSDNGYRVFQEDNSKAAISCVYNSNGIDVLLVDIDMPGWELLVQHTLNTAPDAFVIAMAEKDSICETSALRQHGVHLFLRKPFPYEYFQRALSENVEH